MGYRGKVEDQHRARELRALGWTLAEICGELGVAKSSASLWCRDVVVGPEALEERRRQRALRGNEGARQRGPNKLQLAKQAEIEEMQAAGIEAVGRLGHRDLLLVGAALYAGEGSKTDGAIKFANSDPRIIRLFMLWLRSSLEITESRLRVRLYLHEGLDLDAAEQFWSTLTEIPRPQFTRPYRAVPDPSIRRSKHPMGCPSITYSCSRSHRLVMGLIDALLTCDGSETG